SLKKDAGALTLTVNYADGVSHKRTSTLTVPNNQDHLLFETAEDLFHKACQRRVRVKGLNLVCSKFTTEKRQMDLFAGHAEGKTHYAALQDALDRVRDKYGMQSLQWGRTLR
ncbi:MAG: DNA polymerase IV, partial [Desulfuromonadales bacterium]